MPSPAIPGADSVAAIRTLALVGPAAGGKTTLAEALLVAGGALEHGRQPRARHHGQRLRPARTQDAAFAEHRGDAPRARGHAHPPDRHPRRHRLPRPEPARAGGGGDGGGRHQRHHRHRAAGRTHDGVRRVAPARPPYPVSAEAKEKFKKVFLDAFVEELQRSKQFEVVTSVGPDTLILRAGILDIISEVPPAARHVDVRLSAVGEGTFVVQLIDASSGVIQATVGERRKIQPPAANPGRPATNATVWTDVEQWARALGMDFRRELDKAKKKADEKTEKK